MPHEKPFLFIINSARAQYNTLDYIIIVQHKPYICCHHNNIYILLSIPIIKRKINHVIAQTDLYLNTYYTNGIALPKKVMYVYNISTVLLAA